MKNKQLNIFTFADQGYPLSFEDTLIHSMFLVSLMLIRLGG